MVDEMRIISNDFNGYTSELWDVIRAANDLICVF